METFESAVKILHLNKQLDPKYLRANSELFFRATKEDSTFCDAYFFTGYTSRLLNEFENALVFYYMADSLAVKPSVEFKQNLAMSAMILGSDEIARKKFDELKESFPENPEGYYGVGLTSTIIGDYENGINNLNQAISIYKNSSNPSITDAYYIKAILLTLSEKYEDAISYFEKSSKFKKEPNYYTHYSLALLKTAQKNNDEKMLKEAKKMYGKIEDKTQIPPFLVPLFDFN